MLIHKKLAIVVNNNINKVFPLKLYPINLFNYFISSKQII
jgi:hypothetical protein